VNYTERDLRFTARGDVLYVVVMGKGDQVTVESLSTHLLLRDQVREVSRLGSQANERWERNEQGLVLPSAEALTVFKVT